MAQQTPVVVNPLSLEELIDIKATLLAAQMEIIKPGTAKAAGHDLDDDLNDAVYRVWDAIEREQMSITNASLDA